MQLLESTMMHSPSEKDQKDKMYPASDSENEKPAAPHHHKKAQATWRDNLRQFCDEPLSSPCARYTNWFLTGCIVLSVVAYIWSSMNFVCEQLYTPCALAGEESDYHTGEIEFHRYEILNHPYCFKLMQNDPLYAADEAVQNCDKDKWRSSDCAAQKKLESNDQMWDYWQRHNETCIPPPNNMRRKPLQAVSFVGSTRQKIYCEKSNPRGLNGALFWFIWNVFFNVVFLIEIIVRGIGAESWFCRKQKRDKDEPPANTPFFRDIMTWFDIFAIMPFMVRVPYMLLDKKMPPLVSILGLLRVCRMFKIFRHFEGVNVIVLTLRRSLGPLFISLYFLGLLFIVLSFAMFLFESCVDNQCTFTDPINTGYYATVTILTVGYGDQSPTNWAARGIGVFIMIAGNFYFAMPLAIIGNKFDQVYNEDRAKKLKAKGEKKGQRKEEEVLTWSATKQRLVNSSYQILSVITKIRVLQSKHGEVEGLKALAHHNKLEESCARFKQLHAKMKKDIERVFFHKTTKSSLLRNGESKDAAEDGDDSTDIPTWAFPPGCSSWVALRREGGTPPEYCFTSEDDSSTHHLDDGMHVAYGSDKPSKPPDMLTDRWNQRTCNPCRSKKRLGMFEKLDLQRERENIRNEYAEKRAKNGSCPDKVYLLMDGPMSNGGAKACSRFRAFVSMLSIIVCILQTTGLFNVYGPDKMLCVKQALAWCNAVETFGGLEMYAYENTELGTVRDWNKNCYPQKCCSSAEVNDIPAYMLPRIDGSKKKACLPCGSGWDNITYGGMLKKNPAGKWVSRTIEEITKEGGYPFSHEGLQVDIRCPDSPTTGSVELATAQAFTTKMRSSTSTTGKAPFASDYMSKKLMVDYSFGALDFCSRRQCVSNAHERTGILSAAKGGLQEAVDELSKTLEQKDINAMWAYFELFFCSFFLFEFILRVVATECRVPKPSYPRSELPPDAAGQYAFKNENEYKRAVAQALPGLKEFFLNLYNLLDLLATVCCIFEIVLVTSKLGAFEYEPWGMPVVPFMSRSVLRPLRVVVMLRFIGIQRSFHGFRVLRLTMEAVFSRLIIAILFLILISVLFAGLFFTAETVYYCEIQSKSIFDETSEISWVFTNVTSGIPKGTTCQLQNMFDAWWLSFVTLTTVGYGRLYPVGTFGKGVTIMSAITGTFYMAMPLSIVGNKFHDIYRRLDELERRPMMQKLKRYALLVRSFKKKALRKILPSAGKILPSAVPSDKPKDDTFERYKTDLENFCEMKNLDQEPIVEVQNRIERVIEYVAQDYMKNAHKMENRIL